MGGYRKRAVLDEWEGEAVNSVLVKATHTPSRDCFYVKAQVWDRFRAGDPTAAREMQSYFAAREAARRPPGWRRWNDP